jgi:AraC-like DNA-binding protein
MSWYDHLRPESLFRSSALRIERAKSLLSQGNKRLAEIAQLSGFCDQAAFTRTFSRVEQMTPSRWRKCNTD